MDKTKTRKQRISKQNQYKKSRWIKWLFLLAGVTIAVILAVFLTNNFPKREEIKKENKRLTAASLNHSAWIRDGRMYVAGEPYINQNITETWSSLVQIAISDNHIVALDQSGTAYAAGSNTSLQCEISGLKNVRYIEAGMNCSIGVMDDGTIQIFGIMDETWRQALQQERDVQAVAMGDKHVVLLHHNGTVSAYGANENGQCDVEKWKGVCQITAGYNFTAALTEKGEIVIAGDELDDFADVKSWKNISQIEAGVGYLVGVDKDGEVYAAGVNSQGECDVDDWAEIISVAGGYDHTIGLSRNGTVHAVGFNGSGQCDVS